MPCHCLPLPRALVDAAADDAMVDYHRDAACQRRYEACKDFCRGKRQASLPPYLFPFVYHADIFIDTICYAIKMRQPRGDASLFIT